MAVYFLDTSAVARRDVQETGTAWIRNLADPVAGHSLDVARITDVELTAAVARRRRQGSLGLAQAGAGLHQFRRDSAQDHRIAEITIPLLRHASQLADTHVLRAYDAVQLAAALEIRRQDPSLTLVSADAELDGAATAEGMTVEDPNTHP